MLPPRSGEPRAPHHRDQRRAGGLPTRAPAGAHLRGAGARAPDLNLRGVNATTHPVAPLLIVHGQAAVEGGFNAGLAPSGPATEPTLRLVEPFG